MSHSQIEKKKKKKRLDISLKLNVITQLEFELAYSNIIVQHVSYYISWISLRAIF